MRMRRIVTPTTALFALLPLVARAQPPNQPMTSTEISAACAMPPILIVPPRHPLYVIGTRDTVFRTVFGDDERTLAGAGEFMLIDRGRDRGLAPGSRVAIYRDVRSRLMYGRRVDGVRQPLARVGEAVVLTASPSLAVIRIASSRDAVQAGDYVGIRK